MEEQKELNSFKTKDHNLFLARIYITSNDGSQDSLAYQTKLVTLELEQNKGIDFVLSWKSNGLYTSKLNPLYTAFLQSITLSGYRVRIKFDKYVLAVEQQLHEQNCICLHCLWFRFLTQNTSNNFKLLIWHKWYSKN